MRTLSNELLALLVVVALGWFVGTACTDGGSLEGPGASGSPAADSVAGTTGGGTSGDGTAGVSAPVPDAELDASFGMPANDAAVDVSADASMDAQIPPSEPVMTDVGLPTPVAPALDGSTIFVATSGSDDTGTGTEAQPFATPSRAYAQATPGDVIVLRGGKYLLTDYVRLTQVASEHRRITMMSYPGEWAVLDFSAAPGAQRVWVEGARYNTLRDLEIRSPNAQGVFITGSGSDDNDFVNLVIRNANGSGIQIYQGNRNRFFECLSIFTSPPDAPGDADGFGSIGRGAPSEGNAFYRCVAVNAPDDGFDTWESQGTILVGCWTLRAGVWGGDGSGFKTGPGPGAPNSVWSAPPAPDQKGQAEATILRSVAAFSTANGFDSNGGAGNHYDHNTAYGNAVAFNMQTYSDIPVRTSYLTNNLASGSNQSLDHAQQTTSSWNSPPDITVSDDDFTSTLAPPDEAFADVTGSEAYALLSTGAFREFLRLDAASDAVDVGTDIGLPYRGAAPDLGAFELP